MEIGWYIYFGRMKIEENEIFAQRLWSRRELLRFAGLAAVGTLTGCDRARAGARSEAFAASAPVCVVRPQQTEGPYFVDEKLNRTDIRIDPSDNSARPGVPLRLEFRVGRMDAAACAPLRGAIVDVWHCDALGVYSDVRDAGFDSRGKRFLRGYQVTDASGVAQFLTVYPGWYQGRAVHIHFKIRVEGASRRGYEFTSQLYFDESITDQVHKQAPYHTKARRSTLNEDDFIFRRGGKELLLSPTKSAEGYAAKFDIGLKLS